ncbi:hypothetical protein [Yanshouia hominis]|mgnify:CR=1 FL=1|uniref:Uncharacterized protein n=1 Tax=Yanshouia hominis TaxID=2763673 RepID=A0ABR7NMJ2_9FIRM|nr:hypothetical protein [Yanshouia hominis]MBC8577636.1 hypothetical protein [Yanshouia hominis]
MKRIEKLKWHLLLATDAIATKLTSSYVLELKTEELESLIYPCGFCQRRATTIRSLTEWQKNGIIRRRK